MLLAMLGGTASAQTVTSTGDVTQLTISNHISSLNVLDFDNATAFPMPTLPSLPPASHTFGSGPNNPWEKPYNTKRVATITNGVPATRKPYAAAGKLYFNVGSGTATCSGSLVRPGVVITAAHCVSEFGQQRFFQDFVFVPGKHFGQEFYGRWTAEDVVIRTSYFDGTDNCYVTGIVCENDVALIRLAPQTNFNGVLIFPGDSLRAGRFGVAANDNGFNGFKQAAIAQLGYPASHDNGNSMQESTSQSDQVSAFVDNNIIGSRQTGGSSGGPWLVNQGFKANLAGSGLPLDTINPRNLVVGVTSWGFNSGDVQIQGASRFTTANTTTLLNFLGCTPGSPERHCSE